MQTLQPATNSKIQTYISQAKKPVETNTSKTLEHYQQMEQHLSQSLSLSPKIEVNKQATTDFMRRSSDQASIYYQEKSKSYSQTPLPRAIVAKLNSEVLRVLAAPDFRNRITLEAVAPIGTSPEEFGNFVKSEIVRWAKVVKDSGAKVD